MRPRAALRRRAALGPASCRKRWRKLRWCPPARLETVVSPPEPGVRPFSALRIPSRVRWSTGSVGSALAEETDADDDALAKLALQPGIALTTYVEQAFRIRPARR